MLDSESINIIKQSAINYKKNFAGNNIMFVVKGSNDNVLSFVEVCFYKSSFLHLTGVEIDNTNCSSKEYISASAFLDLCVKGKLKPERFSPKSDGTMSLKLDVLPSLLKENMSANMIGDYDVFSKSLITEKLAGSIYAAMGFVKDNKGRYVPNTIINGDIRFYSSSTKRILSIYKKKFEEKRYTRCVWQVKNVDLSLYRFPKEYEYLKTITY